LKSDPARKSILTAFSIADADWIFDEHETRLENEELEFALLTKRRNSHQTLYS